MCCHLQRVHCSVEHQPQCEGSLRHTCDRYITSQHLPPVHKWYCMFCLPIHQHVEVATCTTVAYRSLLKMWHNTTVEENKVGFVHWCAYYYIRQYLIVAPATEVWTLSTCLPPLTMRGQEKITTGPTTRRTWVATEWAWFVRQWRPPWAGLQEANAER